MIPRQGFDILENSPHTDAGLFRVVVYLRFVRLRNCGLCSAILAQCFEQNRQCLAETACLRQMYLVQK